MLRSRLGPAYLSVAARIKSTRGDAPVRIYCRIVTIHAYSESMIRN